MSVARPTAAAFAPFNEKLGRGVRGRAEAVERLASWGRATRGSQPMVWLHAPSVGEGLMAQAIAAALRERVPGVQIAFTHFSPSAERMRDRIGADIASYLPWDSTSDMRTVMDALQPSALAFVRTEIWPTMVSMAYERGIPSVLVNAVLAPNSSRLRPIARYFLEPAYAKLSAVGAVNHPSADRLRALGVRPSCIRITGDARFDQVWNRIRSLDREQPLLHRLRDTSTFTVVAGSTWPADDEQLIPAVVTASKAYGFRVIIAPHEPTPSHLSQLESKLKRAGLRHARLTEVEKTTTPLPPAIVVDRVGILADLYAIADLSYVGGGFHQAGLHSVVEPAGLGVPVLFGPRHANAAEADELAGRGGGFVVRDAASIASLLLDLVARPDIKRAAQNAAAAYVRSRLGGAERNACLIAETIGV